MPTKPHVEKRLTIQVGLHHITITFNFNLSLNLWHYNLGGTFNVAVNSHRRYTQNSQNAPSTHLQTELYARFVNHVLSPHVYLFMWMYSTFLFAHFSSRRCRITCLCCVWGGNKKSWRPAIYEIRFLFLFFRFLFLIFSYFSYIDLLYKGVPQGESRSSNRIRAVRKKKTNFTSAFRTEKSNTLNIIKIHMCALNVLVSSVP
jgi:hypothetical protein